MEPKLIFWIIGLILYFWIRSKKSSIPGNTPGDNRDSSPLPAPGKTITFEDLLREIETAKSPKKNEAPAETVFDYEEEDLEEAEVEEVKSSAEQTNREFPNDEIYQTYEKAKSDAFARASLEETLKLENTNVTYAKFKEYQVTEKETPASSIADEFKDPDRLKKAFIMGEILNRKWT